MSTLTTARRQTSTKLAGLPLPEAFALATVASEALILARGKRRVGDKADLRRASDKARRVSK